jgi:hypothetical protein
MVVAHLPAERLMYVADLIGGGPLEGYPDPERAALDRFFVGWLDAHGLDVQRIFTAHAAEAVSPAHLERLRD